MNEITSSTLYWVTRLDDIKYALTTLMVFCGLVIIASTCIACYYVEEESWCHDMRKEYSKVPRAIKWVLNGICAFLLCMILYILTPTTNEMSVIVVLPQIAQSKVVQQDMPELYSLAVDELKSVLNDTKKER